MGEKKEKKKEKKDKEKEKEEKATVRSAPDGSDNKWYPSGNTSWGVTMPLDLRPKVSDTIQNLLFYIIII